MKWLTSWRIAALLGAMVCFVLLAIKGKILSTRLDSANRANETLVATVNDRNETITALQDSANADRRATEEQLKIEQEKRSKADAENRTLRQALEHSDCTNQRLPDDALRILRREAQDRASF
ncbi:TPA: DUF2570 family protein [Serratia fonticola]